jgi:hypothetical protein
LKKESQLTLIEDEIDDERQKRTDKVAIEKATAVLTETYITYN